MDFESTVKRFLQRSTQYMLGLETDEVSEVVDTALNERYASCVLCSTLSAIAAEHATRDMGCFAGFRVGRG